MEKGKRRLTKPLVGGAVSEKACIQKIFKI
jgi:hypothetical protein